MRTDWDWTGLTGSSKLPNYDSTYRLLYPRTSNPSRIFCIPSRTLHAIVSVSLPPRCGPLSSSGMCKNERAANRARGALPIHALVILQDFCLSPGTENDSSVVKSSSYRHAGTVGKWWQIRLTACTLSRLAISEGIPRDQTLT